jgi:hypothetical protein
MMKPRKQISMRRLVRLMPMSVLHIEPGDVIVMQTDLILEKDQITTLRDRAVEQFSGTPLKDFKVAVLVGGLKVGVLRKREKKKRV